MELILKNGLPLLQFSHLALQKNIVHAVTTRQGGVSEGPFASLNLGFTTGDSSEHVQWNRRKLLTALEWEQETLATPVQIHGTKVVVVDEKFKTQGTAAGNNELHGVDGLITKEKGVLLTVKVADCFPVFLFDPETFTIGLLHAGWRGTAQGIIAAGLSAMGESFGTKPSNLLAGIGPGIGNCCYPVGEEVWEAFTNLRIRADCFSKSPKEGRLLFNLRKAIYYGLSGAGIKKGNISIADECTSCDKEHFFSHRRDKGRTGRMAAVIGLQD